MAQDIIIRTWCDPCLAEDEHTEGKPYPLANGYVVDVCDVHRKPLDEITAHARKDSTANALHACTVCGKVLQTDRGLRKHMTQQHGDGTPSVPATLAGTDGQTCPDCGKSFPKPQGLSMHRFRVHGTRATGETQQESA